MESPRAVGYASMKPRGHGLAAFAHPTARFVPQRIYGGLEEGMPYQTLVASVLHKYVTGRLEERKAPASGRARSPLRAE